MRDSQHSLSVNPALNLSTAVELDFKGVLRARNFPAVSKTKPVIWHLHLQWVEKGKCDREMKGKSAMEFSKVTKREREMEGGGQ